jgi:hypothetical protein
MPTLASDLRNKLERVVIEARDAAETGARAALQVLAVHHYEPYAHMKAAQIELRNHLRARASQLGDHKVPKGRDGRDQEIDHLASECAYEHWHRMLFARFLAENGLLIEPQEEIAISLAEAEELAKEDGVDVWVFASRCAQRMLPQIFRPDDPLLQVSFATEHMLKLEKLLASLPEAVFTASDALGWVYQFWQSKKKDAINRSEVKIGADEIAAVTQLFTEPYMVEFLLHNTLGAWWAGKKLAAKDAASAETEDELRRKLALPGVDWSYLRFVRGEDGKGGPWWPAAGTFDGWPETAAELKVLDPCCGSGHFLVAALHHVVPIRMAAENLSAAQAVDVVLRDNLHGLEIDERCCQIAAFALAFAVWTYPGAAGYRSLPELHIACTGIAPNASKDQWLRLGEEIAAKGGMPAKRDLFGAEDSLLSSPIKQTLEALHELFSQAPVLGSLIDPSCLRADLFYADYKTVAPLLAKVLEAQSTSAETHERAVAAAGMVKAADLLAGKYTLVMTNVPYLGRGKQDDLIKLHLERHYPEGKSDLATAFVLRCLQFCSNGGTSAMVTPQSWLFLNTYSKFRQKLLEDRSWRLLARLGPGAFEMIGGEIVNTVLVTLENRTPPVSNVLCDLDAGIACGSGEKALLSATGVVERLIQKEQLQNVDCRIGNLGSGETVRLGRYATNPRGLATGDDNKYVRFFWEVQARNERWASFIAPPRDTDPYGGREEVLLWESGQGELSRDPGARVQGHPAWGNPGILLSLVYPFPATISCGEIHAQSTCVLLALEQTNLPSIWAYVTSREFKDEVRRLDNKVLASPSNMLKVPFELDRWSREAQSRLPSGLPDPWTLDPKQYLFHGHCSDSTSPLQVAVARLVDYRWPAELDDMMRLSKRARALVKRCDELAKYADDDGIVCIPSVRGEEPAADRLEALLTAAGIKLAKARELAGGVDLDDWLRNGFFQEHCKLFHDRPFVWHIWDGRKRDGFHALVNYHKLCEGNGKGRKILESLTYAYLGEWITRQNDGVKRGEGGAEDRLAAALELQNRLKSILEGEPPFDLFVRWKSLADLPIGWEPDINDGVRMNIRPFLASDLPTGRTGAGVLRWKPNIKWDKDRGKEPKRPKEEYPWFWNWNGTTIDFIDAGKEPDGNRWNDCHYTKKVKQAARDAAKKGGK